MILRLKYKLNLGVTDCRPLNLRNLYFFVKKVIKYKKVTQLKKRTKNFTLFEISFSGLKNITLKKNFVLIVVDVEVL